MRSVFLAFVYSVVMRGFLKIFVGVKYINKDSLRGCPQYILVANHNSHLDSMALMSAVPWTKRKNVHPVAAGDYFGRSKVKAFITKLFVNALLIPRGRPVDGVGPDPVQMMLDKLAKGRSLILFPEGSRGEAEKLQKFKKGIGLLLEKRPDVFFIPVFMRGMGKVLPKGERLMVPMNAYVVFGEPTKAISKDPDEIVAQVQASILALQDNLPEFVKVKIRKEEK